MKLLHFSEDPNIEVFTPHVATTSDSEESLVWAIDEEHAPSYWFPRDCPRACCWSTTADHPLLKGRKRMHAIESGWLNRIRNCTIYAYSFDPAPFRLKDGNAGYWVTDVEVRPLTVTAFSDLVERHDQAGITLRVVDNLWPVIDAVIASGLDFSIIRKMNAQPRAEG